MEQHIGRIRAVITQFAQEETGNKLSVFAMMALSGLIEQELTAIKSLWEAAQQGERTSGKDTEEVTDQAADTKAETSAQ